MTDSHRPRYTPPAAPVRRLPPLTLEEARERAVALLTDRYADDSISEAEFEARLSWLGAADTPARVDELVADLTTPRASPSFAQGASPPAPWASPAIPEMRILAVMSQSLRTGQWAVPPRVRARAIMSELLIDLRYASLPPACSIDVGAVMAKLTIIVPPELAVECAVSPFMGSVHNDAAARSWNAYSATRLQVTGSAVMSEVRIEVASREYR